MPKFLVEVGERRFGHIRAFLLNLVVLESGCQLLQHAEGVIPKCLDLDRLSMPRSYDPVANFRIHPGKLDARLTSVEQTIIVDMDLIAGSLNMPVNDVR